MKTYVIMLGRTFPATHPRKGELTYFVEGILKELYPNETYYPCYCAQCNWAGWSNLLEGGSPIADTGDYDDIYCPKCGNRNIIEIENVPIMYYNQNKEIYSKLHTCRGNYELWDKRIKEVQAGKAVLSLRHWNGKPYRSKQVEFARLGKNDGVGIQRLDLTLLGWFIDNVDNDVCTKDIATNDGLSEEDFKDYFKGYNVNSEPLAIIHFTKFRY